VARKAKYTDLMMEDINLHAESLYYTRAAFKLLESPAGLELAAAYIARLEKRLANILNHLGGTMPLFNPFVYRWPEFVLTFDKETGQIDIEHVIKDESEA